MAPKQAVFLEGNLFRHIAVMSLAASVGLMAVFIFDFVDMIFISMPAKSELAAAVGYAGAILFFTAPSGSVWPSPQERSLRAHSGQHRLKRRAAERPTP